MMDKKTSLALAEAVSNARGASGFEDEVIAAIRPYVEGSGRIDEIDPSKKDLHGDYGKYCYLGFRHSLCHGWSAGVIRFIQEHC